MFLAHEVQSQSWIKTIYIYLERIEKQLRMSYSDTRQTNVDETSLNMMKIHMLNQLLSAHSSSMLARI